MTVWGYSELSDLIRMRPGIRNGVIVDTNILVSATYELDKYHEDSVELIELLIENQIPLFCNVNIRAEFLEIHRRILFSEAILDFEKQCNKADLPTNLAALLTNYRSRHEKRMKRKPDSEPKSLSEREIKEFKVEMSLVHDNDKDLWTELCDERIGDKLSEIWSDTEIGLGLNPLRTREEDHKGLLNKAPDWDDAVQLMEKQGLPSSDAMIINMFLVSKLEVIASSDIDVGLSILKLSRPNKCCIIPDVHKSRIV